MAKIKRQLSRLITLSYLQSIQVSDGSRDAYDFTAVGQNFSGTKTLLERTKNKKSKASLQSIVNTLFPYLGSLNKRMESDSGWVINDILPQTYWDLITWRIGVKEVGLSSFTFGERSAIVTVPILSPKPIWKVTLKADELIPSVFSPLRAWIKYFITPDNGLTWHQINPLGKPTRFDDEGNVIPKIITFNSESRSFDPEQIDLKIDDVKEIRMKIEMERDITKADSDRLSPVLRSYKIVIYPRGGISGSLPESQ